VRAQFKPAKPAPTMIAEGISEWSSRELDQ
jgi:hypothetical protein